MTANQRTIRKLLLAAAATLSLGAMGTAAHAGLSVEIAVPGIVIDARDPYYYSPDYCEGCWYGEWGGRMGYHRGGGRPWEREHRESDHHGRDHGRDVRHEGHR